MCNAYRHPPDCGCGFGPPYEHAEVNILRLSSPANNRTAVAAELRVRFPIARDIRVKRLNQKNAVRAKKAAKNVVQRLADRRFGTGKIVVNVTRIAIGSIEFDVVLITGTGVAVYKFVKDYDQFKKNIIILCKDIASGSRYLKRAIKKAIIFESEESVKKYSGEKRKKKKRNSDK